MADRDEAPRGARFVFGARVGCPARRADTDVEECWRCPWLRDADEHEPPRYVVCATPSEATPLLTAEV